MTKVVGVRFKRAGKIYFFSPGDLDIEKDTDVIVETTRGVEYGTVVIDPKEVMDDEIVSPLKSVIRIATDEDRDVLKENKGKEKEAFVVCLKKIEKHNIPMKLIDVEYTFDNNKILFYFTADGRVDFRELVKDLASVFRTRIELRQVGVRDETKILGGLGICGRTLCCNTFLNEFQPVSIKMAKEQSLSLNPAKISGACGRLMCCLKYEYEAYGDLIKSTPGIGTLVKTVDGKGEVMDVNLLKGTLKVKLMKDDETDVRYYSVKDVKVIRKRKGYKVVKDSEDVSEEELKNLED